MSISFRDVIIIIVIIINGDGGCRIAAYRRTHSPSQVAWSEGRRPLGAIDVKTFQKKKIKKNVKNVN